MAAEPKEKKSKAQAEGGAVKEKKAKEPKAAAEAAPAEAPAAPKAPAAPRVPSDPRLRILKKFEGKFLPKGELRPRFKALMDRWKSGESHGGVTADELKAVLADWKKTKAARGIQNI